MAGEEISKYDKNQILQDFNNILSEMNTNQFNRDILIISYV